MGRRGPDSGAQRPRFRIVAATQIQELWGPNSGHRDTQGLRGPDSRHRGPNTGHSNLISRHRGLFPRGRAQFQDTGRDLNPRFEISESRGPAQRPRFKTHREARAQFRYAGTQIQAQGLFKFMRHGSGCMESISEHRDPIPGGRRDSNSGRSGPAQRPRFRRAANQIQDTQRRKGPNSGHRGSNLGTEA